MNVLEAARAAGVERMLVVSSACVYPRECTIPTPETEGFRDNPEPTTKGMAGPSDLLKFKRGSMRKNMG